MEKEESRIRFSIRAASGCESLSALCREFGISRPTGRKWRDRYHACGCVSELQEKSRRPHRSPRRSSAALEQQVIELRKRYGWGARKLTKLLANDGVQCPRTTTHRILKRNGLVAAQPARREAVGRFERARPNELW